MIKIPGGLPFWIHYLNNVYYIFSTITSKWLKQYDCISFKKAVKSISYEVIICDQQRHHPSVEEALNETVPENYKAWWWNSHKKEPRIKQFYGTLRWVTQTLDVTVLRNHSLKESLHEAVSLETVLDKKHKRCKPWMKKSLTNIC